ncbi:Uncharacterised protein [Mycobacteroides abscessus subsp. massiliense]|nr:Uncharacterised protein [Mycobacteroides abscessus subsp. massiliense]
MPSVIVSFAVTASRSPATLRTACTTARATLARLASDPPYSSLRLLNSGLRKELTK